MQENGERVRHTATRLIGPSPGMGLNHFPEALVPLCAWAKRVKAEPTLGGLF
jgi:hypothetical protein